MQDMGWTLLVHRACAVSKREASPVPSLMMATSSSAVRACSVSTRSATLRWASSSRSALGQLVARMGGSWHLSRAASVGKNGRFSSAGDRTDRARRIHGRHRMFCQKTQNQHKQPRTPTHLTHIHRHAQQHARSYAHCNHRQTHTDKVSKHANTRTRANMNQTHTLTNECSHKNNTPAHVNTNHSTNQATSNATKHTQKGTPPHKLQQKHADNQADTQTQSKTCRSHTTKILHSTRTRCRQYQW